MDSPPDVDDSPNGALSSDERAALAAWADEGDAPDGFADRVVAAYLAEQAEQEDEFAERRASRARTEPRTTIGGGRARRAVGWIAALSAAAIVMLMVRVLPRASEVEGLDPGTCNHAEADPGAPAIARAEGQSAPQSGPSEPDHAVLGAQAAQALAHHCTPCHDSTDPDAKVGALQVFDLDQSYWWPTMSDAQLEDARGRVQELEAATDDERRHVDAFVDAERRRRAQAGEQARAPYHRG
jgi:hypothetical protein